MIKIVINNVCANTYQKDIVLTSVALQASTTYAPKHLISLLYNSFDEYVFNEKANFFIKAWQSTQLSRQYNYIEANTCLFLWSKLSFFKKYQNG